jgi:NitT/TauT family transport system ATP-binding protein
MTGELRIDRLSKSFEVASKNDSSPWHTVFDDVTFTVHGGEFVSVIGPSGCGKSTLMNIIAGLEQSSGGAVYIDDRAVNGPGMDRGVVFQEFALFPWLNVRDNIVFGLKSLGLPADVRKARAEKYIKLVGLDRFSDYYPNRLSGGMRQRVGIGRALAIEPAVLLMDEPFGALDALTRRNMQAALEEIYQCTRKTILFITHDIDEAVYLSDRVMVLNGNPSQILLEVRVDLARPRDHRNPKFQDLVQTLQDAIIDGGAPPTADMDIAT